jgi:hypothetical protein
VPNSIHTRICHHQKAGSLTKRARAISIFVTSTDILRLKQGARKLNPLNLPSKFGVWLLALLLFGLPLLNCVTPAQAMTTAEKDCCKKMAGECGRAGMAKSHSCCQSSSSLDTRPLAKVASPTIPHFTLAMTDVIPQAVILVSAHAFLNPWVMQFHSPPAETPPDNTVLRI